VVVNLVFNRTDQQVFHMNWVGKAPRIIDEFGGGGGIRTHGDLSATPVFKTGAFNHSATPPRVINQALSIGSILTAGVFAHFFRF
jgi:hypothetical protein